MGLFPDIEPGSIAVVFSGQGVTKRRDVYDYMDAVAQVNGQGVNRNLSLMEEASKLPLSKYRTDRDEDVLGNTQVVQTLLGATHLAAIEILRLRIPESTAVKLTAGHSSGEMAAMIFAGVFSHEEGIQLMAERGRLMHNVAVIRPSGLFIPLGLNREKVEEVVVKTKRQIPKSNEGEVVELALANDVTLNVIGVTQNTLTLAQSVASELGSKRNYPVDSEGAWHTEIMVDTVAPMNSKLRSVTLSDPIFPIALNDGTVATHPEIVVSAHVDRLTNTSEWLTAVKRFVNIETIIMVGPGGKIVGFNEGNGFQSSQLVSFFDFVK